jgi:hypothetical protein
MTGTSLVPQTETTATATTPKEPLWKSWEEFYAGNPQALTEGYYGGSAGLPPTQFAKEYDVYRAGLPKEYQILSSAGINPADVESGKVKKVWDQGSGKMLDIPLPGGGFAGQGTGSTHTLDPDVLGKNVEVTI